MNHHPRNPWIVHPTDARLAAKIAALLDDVEAEILALRVSTARWVAPEASPWLVAREEAAGRKE